MLFEQRGQTCGAALLAVARDRVEPEAAALVCHPILAPRMWLDLAWAGFIGELITVLFEHLPDVIRH
jgi:hypothetical protein